jgi:ATP-dependent RNA helicase RhlE
MLPRQRQNLLFSATYSTEVKRLTDSLLHNPAMIEVARRNAAAETVAQHVYHVEQRAKSDLLIHLVEQGAWLQVLVFTRTKHGANRLAEQLNRAGIEAMAIHGNKSQGARTRALAGFKDGRVRVLVATDIAARGLDISRLPHVVNYELPNVPEDYVHRIGRTGRACEEGAAVSLVSFDELKLLRGIQRLLKKEILLLSTPASVPSAVVVPCKPQFEQVPKTASPGRRRARSGRKPSSSACASSRAARAER